MQPHQIGILSTNDPRRGLWRDAETLLWALQQPPLRRGGRQPASVSLFPVAGFAALQQRPETAPAAGAPISGLPTVVPGLAFGDWLERIDTLIVCEKLLPDAFALARRRGLRLIYIPNLDWATLGGSPSRWADALRSAGCDVWAKTEQIARALADAGVASHTVPWSIPDPVIRERAARPDGPITFLLNAGMGGWRNRRGVDIALRAFELARRQLPSIRLVVKSIRPLARNTPAELLDLPGLERIEAMLGRDQIAALYRRADAVLYPSRWEGFGLSLLEALHAGAPLIASDGWPMNELVKHGHNGLLVAARRAGTIRLAPWWECDPADLAGQMLRFAADAELRRRLTCPEPSELAARQHRFVLRVRELALREPPPRALIFRSPLEPASRRSEEYWADALRLHGYAAEVICFDAGTDQIRAALARPHDFALVSKAPASLLRTIGTLTDRPVVAWHHDDCALMRRWTRSAAGLIDLLCVPQSELSGLPAPAMALLPGAKLDGDRGPGRRPLATPPPDSGPEVVFLGNYQPRGSRVALLQSLAHWFDLKVYGRGWNKAGVPSEGPLWGQQAAAASRGARLTLSVSSGASAAHYTSNRLFNACAAGACVLAEAFPGLDDHYPPAAVASFRGAEECRDTIRLLLADQARRTAMRAAAEDHTWRNHTWADRVGSLLARLPNLAIARRIVGAAPADGFWDERARRMGRRAVGYFRWSESRFQAESQGCWERLRPHLLRLRTPEHQQLLDFGCGFGRFSTRLAAQGFSVVGVDSSHEMIRLAAGQAGPGLRFFHLVPGQRLPFADGSFDALWTFTVLQHIPDGMLPAIVAELRRVLRRGALLSLCENTHPSPGRTSRSGHMVFRQPAAYAAMLPGLAAVDSFVIEGERHTIFSGQLA